MPETMSYARAVAAMLDGVCITNHDMKKDGRHLRIIADEKIELFERVRPDAFEPVRRVRLWVATSDDMRRTDWRVVEFPKTTQGRFEWAMQQMRDGFYVTNPDIEPQGYGICIEAKGGVAMLLITHHVRAWQGPWTPTAADILRTDWRLWEMPDGN